MNKEKKFVLHIISTAIMIFGFFIIPAVLVCLVYNDYEQLKVISIIMTFCITIGAIGQKIFNCEVIRVTSRICFMTTIFAWLTLILITSIPFYFCSLNISYIDAIFESVAAWTTTGISVINSDVMPIGLQMLHASCNWMGGLGIIVLALTFLPTWQFVGRSLVVTELPGPGFIKSNTTFRKAYRRSLFVYIGLTVLQYIILRFASMPRTTAVITSLSNISTSGLVHINNGNIIALSASVKIIISIFAFFGSINFSFFILISLKKFREAFKNPELKFHAARIIITSFIISLALIVSHSVSTGIRDFGNILMQVTSYFSTSGFMITDTSSWPATCRALIIMQLFIGACAISSGGGIKAARIIIAFKTIKATIYRHIHRNAIRPINFGGEPLKLNTLLRSNLFIAVFIITYLLGALILSLDLDISSALNISVSMLSNTGSYIGKVLTPSKISDYSLLTKLTMCVLMIAGRLEIYPVLLIFFRGFWRSNKDFI